MGELKLEILSEIYDEKRIGEPFKAISLIFEINVLESYSHHTQHNYILDALHHGIDEGTVARSGGKFVLTDNKTWE